MKKIVIFSCLVMMASQLIGKPYEKYQCFDGAITTGFAFKHEREFKDVYKHGVISALTGDLCFYPWKHWGVGGKLSYWRRKGRTSFLQQRAIVQQLPFTIYLRGRKEFDCNLQLYASLGGGGIWTKEKSYLGKVKFTKGIGELEVGLRYPIWRTIGLTTAFRYLFPSVHHNCEKVMVGAYELRVGIGFSF